MAGEGVGPEVVRAMQRAVEGIALEELAALPPGALAEAYRACRYLADHGDLQGLDDDSEVSGADAVDALAEVWSSIRAVRPAGVDNGDQRPACGPGLT
jgi:hypothetical protein